MPKGLFIGLGGMGIATLSKLKAKLFHDAYDQNMDKMNQECKFIFYDTDPKSKNDAFRDPEICRLMGTENSIIEESSEYITAASVAPQNLFNNAKIASSSDVKSQRMLEWMLDPENYGFTLPSRELNQGASASRMAGRVGVMDRAGEFETKIRNKLIELKSLDRQGENQEVQRPCIWVFASSNGGSGSAALLDVLYLADRFYRNQYENDPYLRLVLYMPKPFIDLNDNNKSYSINGYATLWELNAFRYDRIKNKDGKKFGAFSVIPDSSKDPWKVCSYVMGVDWESKAGNLDSLPEMIKATANICYYIHKGAVGEEMASNLDNDMGEGHMDLYYNNFKTTQTEKFEWARFVLGSGYRVITKADDFLKDYVERRLRYDLFSYGLLGFDFEKILPNEDDQREAAKDFAKNYILKHLVDIDNFENSDSHTLYGYYRSRLEKIDMPIAEGDNISTNDWMTIGDTFISSCEDIGKNLRATFYGNGQKEVLAQIEKSVKEGVEKCIVDNGLNYTCALLNMVDDQYCEKILSEKFDTRNNIEDKILAISNTISEYKKKPTKGIPDLIDALTNYRKEYIRILAVDHIRDVILKITQNEVGLLEYLRKGDGTHYGLSKLTEAFKLTVLDCETKFDDLATTFKRTKKEPCTEYFPRVSDMVDDKGNWVVQNMFEKLYESVLPLEKSGRAMVIKNKKYGYPPKRLFGGDKGLANIIKEIKKDEKYSSLFAEMALGDETNFRELRNIFEHNIKKYLSEKIFGLPNDVNDWLYNKKLANVFDDQFAKADGTTDEGAIREFISKFNASIPIFYPTRSGMTSDIDIAERYLYAGATKDFAKKMGFNEASNENQYIDDRSLGNSLLVCKFEVGHNFYDYKYFDEISKKYEDHRDRIEKGDSGCHIHKGFLKRDIVNAYERIKTKRFTDFIKLCWFDSYFELLKKSTVGKELLESFFGKKSSNLLDLDVKTAGSLKEESDLLSDSELLDIDDENLNLDENNGDNLDGISMDLNGSEDDFDLPEEIEEGLELGYRSIVKIDDDLSVEMYPIKKSDKANRLAFGEAITEELTGSSLTAIRKAIINKLDVDYSKTYFANILEMFESFSPDVKKQLIKLHIANRENIRKVFLYKINPIMRKRQKSSITDEKVSEILQRCLTRLYGKNIFK